MNLPNSSPMIPAPMTTSLWGTDESERAPVDETTVFSSIGMWGRVAISDPVAMTILLAWMSSTADRLVDCVGTGGSFGAPKDTFAVIRRDADAVGAEDGGMPPQTDHLVLLEEKLDAPGERPHAALLLGHHAVQIEAEPVELDAPLGEALAGLRIQVRVVEEGLGGDASDVETRAAQGGSPLHAGRAQTQLGRLDGAHVAPRPGPDENHIILGPGGVGPPTREAANRLVTHGSP